MWPSLRSRCGVDRTLIMVGGIIVVLSTVPPIVSVAAARVPHSRARMAASRAPSAADREPAAGGVLKQQTEVLAGLQVSQSALEKQTTDFNTAIQRRMNQFRVDFADFRRKTQQTLEQTNQRINSIRRWLQSVIVFLMLSLGWLFYVTVRLLKVQDNSFKWNYKAPETSPAEEEILRWQEGEAANSHKQNTRD